MCIRDSHGGDLDHAPLEVRRRPAGQGQPVGQQRRVLGEDQGVGSRDGDAEDRHPGRHAGGQGECGVPSRVPILGSPISAADTMILTKNQALLVYRLALACGAPPDFQRRMIEITPVIGGAVIWRQIAGALIGLVPGYGVVPKTAVAFGGTYVVGLAATRWYETGVLTEAERKRIVAEATAKARDATTAMVEQARVAGGKAGVQAQGGLQKVGQGAAAARAQAGKVVDGARKATGTATGKAGVQAQRVAQRLREGSKKVVRRKPRGVTDAAGEVDQPVRPPDGSTGGGESCGRQHPGGTIEEPVSACTD